MSAQEKRAEAVRLMKSRVKMNTYTNGENRKYFFGKPDNRPGNTTQKGYSDCSSACRKAIMGASGIDIGSNTDAQIRNRARGIIVDQTSGYYPDESKLIPGDCLYFKGNRSHAMDVGHVEMYTGKNECYGHGSGVGPNRHNLKSYCKSRASASKRYFMAIRWIVDGEEQPRRTLKEGCEGSDVAKLQGDLITLGYSCGKWGADGDFGSATSEAVKAFQTKKKLTADGIVGEKTWAALEAAMEALGDTDEDEVPEKADGTIAVAEGSWNVRTGPGVKYAVAGIVRQGDKLEEVKAGDWKPVVYNGEVCWISKKALKG